MNDLSMRRARRVPRAAMLVATLLAATTAQASMFQGEALDKAADVLAWVVLIVVPLAGLWLFWLVHILPEKIAEQKGHPQAPAIKMLCLLSLVFGGMLWPIAWLWAYSKPVMYKLAYGTDKHEDFYKEAAPGVPAAAQEIARLRADIERLTAMGVDADDLRAVKRELAKLESRLAGSDGKEAG